ncbi:MAG: hypothetical protein ACYS8W_13045 [Planctomycetota bacterium]|jgi:hypothetical protein
MKSLKYFAKIIDLHMLIVTALCMLAIFLALHFNLVIALPTTLISVAMIFPVVFAINASYKRREQALTYFADIKGHAVATYFAGRDWLPDGKTDLVEKLKNRWEEFFEALHRHLAGKATGKPEDLKQVYDRFSGISGCLEEFRKSGMPTGEMSRINQYLKTAMVSFERMRNIKLYRTPVTLRAFNQIFLNAFPILFAPYFAHIASNSYTIVGYLVGVLYSVVLISLDNIQEELENPYDSIGEDDLKLDIAQTYSSVMEGKPADSGA